MSLTYLALGVFSTASAGLCCVDEGGLGCVRDVFCLLTSVDGLVSIGVGSDPLTLA